MTTCSICNRPIRKPGRTTHITCDSRYDGPEEIRLEFWERKKADRNGEFGEVDLLHQTFLTRDGLRVDHVEGRSDGEYINERSETQLEGPIDLSRVIAARERTGWRVVRHFGKWSSK